MLTSTKAMLTKAHKEGYAVPSANFIDYETAKAHVSVAEKLNMPLILSFAESHIGLMSLKEAATIGKFLANESKTDVALHLDHGMKIEVIKEAIELGFTSVMIDASSQEFSKNVELTKEVVQYAHNAGVPVEAEIGHVGAGVNFENHAQDDSVYTDVKEAVKFAQQTEVDSLAISIGTAHGTYSGTPKINFERLGEIRNAIDIPLVLHGGSSTGDENLSKCASHGISKINIFTDFVLAGVDAINKGGFADYFEAKDAVKEAVSGTLEHYYSVYRTQPNEQD